MNIVEEEARDLTALTPLLCEPFRHIHHIPTATRRAFWLLGFAAVVPLAVTVLNESVEVAYWALALYFSLLWAVFFQLIYHSRGARPQISAAMYFGTGIISLPLLLLVLGLGLEAWRDPILQSHNLGAQLAGYVFGVGLVEELTKMLALFVLLRFTRIPPLSLFIFYGLMSGLGFGFYEGVKYQMGTNFEAAGQNGDSGIIAMSTYYILNVLRLTSAPFTHATWTGIAAFMIWFGVRFPARRIGFFTIAIALPALLHGLYDFFGATFPPLMLVVALVSIGLLAVYVGVADRLEERLGLAPGTDEDLEAPLPVIPEPKPSLAPSSEV